MYCCGTSNRLWLKMSQFEDGADAAVTLWKRTSVKVTAAAFWLDQPRWPQYRRRHLRVVLVQDPRVDPGSARTHDFRAALKEFVSADVARYARDRSSAAVAAVFGGPAFRLARPLRRSVSARLDLEHLGQPLLLGGGRPAA